MGCCRNDDDRDFRRHDNCICEVLRAIKRIQDVREDFDCNDCNNDCFLAPIGSVRPTQNRPNTRVFMLLDKNGDPFKAFFKRRLGGTEICGFSIFFRVQKVFDNCCATLEVLAPFDGTSLVDLFPNNVLDMDAVCDVNRFVQTRTCVTVDLKCFCGVQCVRDVHLRCEDD